MDKLDIIYDMLKVVDAKQDEQTARQIRMEINIGINTDDLANHIKRTDLLEESLNLQKAAVNQRFMILEEPRNTAKSLGKMIVWIGGIAGAAYSIYRLYLLI